MPFFLALAALLWGTLLPAAPSPAARVVSVNGQATVKEKSLKPGDSIFAGEEIRTRERSGVKLLLADRSIVDIGASTVFKVIEAKVAASGERNVDLALDSGTVRTSVTRKLDKKSKFFIRTKSSVMAVRGTEFTTSWELVGNEVNQQVTVAEGEVHNTSQGVIIPPGQQHVLVGNLDGNHFIPLLKGATGTTGLVLLSSLQLKDVLSTSRVADRTFLQNILVGDDAQGEAFRRATAATNVTISSVSAAVVDTGAARRLASENATARATEMPSQAMGQDVSNGASPIPGFAGIPGTGIIGPGPGTSAAGTAAPQVLVNVNVVLNPAP